MGAGKTTFARALIEALGVVQPPEGSPTFAIAHEYHGPRVDVVHVDLYRIKHAEEIDEAGIPEYLWNRPRSVAIVEWASMFPEFEASVIANGRNWHVSLAFVAADLGLRSLTVVEPR